jgi:hypothetical protein
MPHPGSSGITALERSVRVTELMYANRQAYRNDYDKKHCRIAEKTRNKQLQLQYSNRKITL